MLAEQHLDCDQQVDISRLCPGHVPFVPQTFLPICVDLQKSGLDIPDVPRAPTQVVPDTLSRHSDHQIALCFIEVFFS